MHQIIQQPLHKAEIIGNTRKNRNMLIMVCFSISLKVKDKSSWQ